jgi:hypothetical protein
MLGNVTKRQLMGQEAKSEWMPASHINNIARVKNNCFATIGTLFKLSCH